MKRDEALRAVYLARPHQCGCGFEMTHLGICIYQPQPEPGDFVMCPQCFEIYQLGDDLGVATVRQRDIPVEYLIARDRLLARGAV